MNIHSYKLGIILENKVFQKLELSKSAITRNVLLNKYLWIKIILRKIQMVNKHEGL